AEELLGSLVARGSVVELEARTELGELLFLRGRLEEATRELYRLIDLYNERDRLTASELVAVARAVRILGRDDPQLFKDALKAFDEAVAADPADPEPRVRTAVLFLEKYDSGEARTSLQPVLERNPNHPEALLALARVRRFDGSPEARVLVDRALAVNPNLVSARVFSGQLLLELELFDEAREEAERALQVAPRSLEALSMLAAAQYLADEPEAFAATERKVLDANPRHAELYNVLAEACVQNRLYRAARDFAAQSIRLDPKSWRGWGELGLNQLRLGEMAEGRRSLETAFAGDPYNVWLKNTLDLLDTLDGYRVVPWGRFELVLHPAEADLLAPYVGSLAEEAYDYLAKRYRHEPPTPIRVEVFKEHEDFSVRTVGLAGLGALGVSFGPVIALDSPAARELGGFNWGTTLWHELAHSFTLGVTENQIPRWLTEGLSVFEERGGRTGWGDDVRPEFVQMIADGSLLGLAEFNDGFVRPTFPGQVVLSYFQASLICELIDREWGFDKILQILEGYRQRKDTETIFREVLGLELEAFDAKFSGWLAQRYASALPSFPPRPKEGTREPATGEVIGLGRGPDPAALEAWAKRSPEDFRAQLAWGTALYRDRRYDEAIEYLERAKRVFPEYAAEEGPHHLLARIHREAGRKSDALRELETMTGINEFAYRPLLDLAELYGELDRPAEQAEALERSMYIYPHDVDPHRTLAELYERLERPAAAVTEWRAVAALRPASRAEALYRAAANLARTGDRRGARREVLRALEIAPGYEDAQVLLLDLTESSS
ncbi:MAG TPA: tetratricopeptide repeat protein, partial [Thermoanaerobaculia bacterium]|nr:tetratricopeptide repeat protein [Thermoanaerobaculia bacterium]